MISQTRGKNRILKTIYSPWARARIGLARLRLLSTGKLNEEREELKGEYETN
jgi:hypothetical protein